MKFLQALKRRARRINNLVKRLKQYREPVHEVYKGLESQVKALEKYAPSAGKIAQEKMQAYVEHEKDFSGVDVSKPYHNAEGLKANIAKLKKQTDKKLKIKYQALQGRLSNESLNNDYDVLSYKNMVTKAAVTANKDLGVKVKVREDGARRMVYNVDYSDVPKDKKTHARSAIRKSTRHLKANAGALNKLMGAIKKVYFNNSTIANSDQVFEKAIEVVKRHEYKTDADSIDEMMNEVMNSAK